ncbi:cell division protein ZapA [Pseudoalteromonas fenneropenaei]|uniref:Cell division protein ZapA n=1 Tax=Pseudoalteromonas fenneropenaei TaxID=1737459 RepID=A0ABV7CLY4_9GAMM
MADKSVQVSVELLGKTQQFTCESGQEHILLEAVSLLNTRVCEMRQRATVRNDHNALLLAALHLCHEYNALQKEQKNTSHTLQMLCEKLSQAK